MDALDTGFGTAEEILRMRLNQEIEKMPAQMRDSGNPYVYGVAVKNLMRRGIVALYLKAKGGHLVRIEGDLALREIDHTLAAEGALYRAFMVPSAFVSYFTDKALLSRRMFLAVTQE